MTEPLFNIEVFNQKTTQDKGGGKILQ